MQLDDQDYQSSECTKQLNLPLPVDPTLKALQLTEALRELLEGQGGEEEQDSVKKQLSHDTADIILKWLERDEENIHSNTNSESYQDRLSRLEGDKQSLILQVSVLTDQVEAQGVKISDLESSLVEHQQKLNSTEEMLQQELLHRTSLENQKLSLMGEVSYLKLTLADMEGRQGQGAEKQHKAEGLFKELRILKDKVEQLEDQKLQYEKKLKTTKAEINTLQQHLLSKNAEIESLHNQLLARPSLTSESSEKGKQSTRLQALHQPANNSLALSELPSLMADTVIDSFLHSLTCSNSCSEESVLALNKVSHHGSLRFQIFIQRFVYPHPYRLRRTQSGGLQAMDPDVSQFRRGGLRATAGPRLTRTLESYDSARQWTREQVCGWLEDYGLGQYVSLTRQWVENGQTLLSATPQDFEKEMGMKNPLHRKKLQLALSAVTTKVVEKSSELDHIWVTRWLDDIGLPQYKDQFHEARVDGRMIQYLTVNDLLTLKVTSQLHHLSIKCAIHVLHANKFNPNCLRRRPGEEKQPSPSEVVQWSNHRVMEWLRAVDLAEYAPNLRGSGVHGGLIILEPRFSSETLALLLNIPPQKTLLRRHLATAFSALVGTQGMQEKREYGNATGHVPLTTTAKVKPKKLGFTQFSHLRKRKPDESADYICPTDWSTDSEWGFPITFCSTQGPQPQLGQTGWKAGEGWDKNVIKNIATNSN
uniref:PPFIA binding protein 2a n=1 Tax=Mastacembelus armatus TaxID=205130 RepID=A0A7N8WYK9_9TELE